MQRARLVRARPSYFAGPQTDIEFFSSGSKLLDLALGGGWAECRIANIIGDKSSGKTLLCIEASANFARKYADGLINYREAEAAFSEAYAEALGMPLGRVDFGRAPLVTVEDLFNDLSGLIRRAQQRRRPRPTLYILDSLDALSDAAEIERAIDAGSYRTQKAKVLSEVLRRLAKPLAAANITTILVSQVRQKIGLFFGRPEIRAGGLALNFYASQVLWLHQLGMVEKARNGIKRTVGVDIRGMVEKNKVGLPFREADFTIQFGYGIDDVPACLRWLKRTHNLRPLGIPDKFGPYLSKLARYDRTDYRHAVRRIHTAVADCWYQVETSFLPRHRKYD